LAAEIPDLVDSNPLALRLNQKNVWMMKTIYLQAGGAFITGVFIVTTTVEGLCQVKSNQFLPNPILSHEEVSVGYPSIPHGISEVFYLPIVSDNLLERHFGYP